MEGGGRLARRYSSRCHTSNQSSLEENALDCTSRAPGWRNGYLLAECPTARFAIHRRALSGRSVVSISGPIPSKRSADWIRPDRFGERGSPSWLGLILAQSGATPFGSLIDELAWVPSDDAPTVGRKSTEPPWRANGVCQESGRGEGSWYGPHWARRS